jgi:hypothetical protein
MVRAKACLLRRRGAFTQQYRGCQPIPPLHCARHGGAMISQRWQIIWDLGPEQLHQATHRKPNEMPRAGNNSQLERNLSNGAASRASGE